MNRRQTITHSGFQMPAGLRSVQRPPNMFTPSQTNQFFGGNATYPFMQQPAQKKGLFSAFKRNSPPAQGAFNQMFQPYAQPETRGIASLFGGQTANAGSGVTGALSMENIQRWVGSTQQMINTAQQALPMIQQYGPLVRNFPAMWKLYRSLKNEDSQKDEADTEEAPLDAHDKFDEFDNNALADEEKINKPQPRREKTSVPRLYV